MYELKYCFVVFDGISSFFFFFLLRSEPSSHTSYLCPSGSCDTRSMRRHDAGRRGAASDEFWSGVTPATVWTQHQLRNWFQFRSVASFFFYTREQCFFFISVPPAGREVIFLVGVKVSPGVHVDILFTMVPIHRSAAAAGVRSDKHTNTLIILPLLSSKLNSARFCDREYHL